MAFCEDCNRRATCKQMCRELAKHLAHTCRANNSPKAALWGDMDKLESMHGPFLALWPRRVGDDAFGDPLPPDVDDPEDE